MYKVSMPDVSCIPLEPAFPPYLNLMIIEMKTGFDAQDFWKYSLKNMNHVRT